MKLGVIGSRNFTDTEYAEKCINEIREVYNFTSLISGGARGADHMAEVYSAKHNIPIKLFLPDWNKYGKAAGFLRNTDIVKSSDIILAFWDGKSRGTLDSLRKAVKLHKIIIIKDI